LIALRTQTEHGEGRYTAFVCCLKQNYNVVWLCVSIWLTHVISYFLHIVDRDGKQALALTGRHIAQRAHLDRRA
jgi:hypothetical protein